MEQKARKSDTNGVCLRFRPRSGGGERGAPAVWSEASGPAQQVLPEVAEQEAVRWDPAGGVEHAHGAVNEVLRGGGLGDCGQRGAQRFGLRAEAAEPELAALIRGRRRQRGLRRLPWQDPRDEEHRDHGDAEAQVGQGETGQQRDGPAASLAEVTADSDRAVEVVIDDGAGVESVGFERVLGKTLRAARGTMKTFSLGTAVEKAVRAASSSLWTPSNCAVNVDPGTFPKAASPVKNMT